jgi:aspartyl-tRNA(Asn)/glutamyl-tRNA(Gln) amidotransferase subunit A
MPMPNLSSVCIDGLLKLPSCACAVPVARNSAATLARNNLFIVIAMDARLSDLDALVLPTAPIVAPMITEVASSEGFTAKNGMVLRNPAIVNFFDLCAISLPLPRAGGLPAGLMLVARNGHDRRLFRMAAAVERVLAA